MPRVPDPIGVCGAGTMGAGIARLAAAAGARVRLYDPEPGAAQRGADGVPGIEPAQSLGELAGCALVIEAAPERLELKRELFAALEGIVGADAVLATNTSSLPVTAIAGGLERPERVVGLHFFNPPERMPLVEVVAGERSGEAAPAIAPAAGAAVGKHAGTTGGGPRLLLEPCQPPLKLQGPRVVAQGVAT